MIDLSENRIFRPPQGIARRTLSQYYIEERGEKVLELVLLLARFFDISSVRRRLNAHALHVRVSSLTLRSLLLVVFVGEGKERESVVPANLCIVVGCATKRARGYRDRRGKGGQLYRRKYNIYALIYNSAARRTDSPRRTASTAFSMLTSSQFLY